MAAEPPEPPAAPAPARGEMHDAAPLLSWRKLYVVVLAALAAEIAVFAVVTWAFR